MLRSLGGPGGGVGGLVVNWGGAAGGRVLVDESKACSDSGDGLVRLVPE